MASLIWFLLIFSVVVISHEFGHYIIARASGIHVLEFYVGFGPTLFHFEKGGTKYSWKLLPLGGACVFEGQDGLALEAGEEPGEGSFLKASPWSRLATVFAGPLFNVILGFLLAFVMVCLVAVRDPVATEVLPGSAAEEAGLQAGDRILYLNGQRVCLYEDITLYTLTSQGESVYLVYERDGQNFTTAITPQYNADYGRYMLGISNATFVDLKGTDYFEYAYYEVRYNFKATYASLRMLIHGKVGRQDVAGPVGIAVNVVGKTYEEASAYGMSTVIVNMLNIALMLTINLGILNLLPIPALDGGRLVFIILEILRGKPVPPEKEGMVHFIGMMFFMVLIVIVFFNDLRNIFGW